MRFRLDFCKISLLVLVFLILCVPLSAAYPSPDELYKGSKEYYVEHTNPRDPIVWVFYGTFDRSGLLPRDPYFQDYSAVYVIQRGDELVGFVEIPQAKFLSRSSIESDIKKRLRAMRDWPGLLGDLWIQASYHALNGDPDYIEVFRIGLGGGFCVDEAKIEYLDPHTSQNTFKLPVKPGVTNRTLQFDPKYALKPSDSILVSSFKRYLGGGLDWTKDIPVWLSHGDAHFIRKDRTIVGVEIIPRIKVKPGGLMLTDNETTEYMQARLADLELRALNNGGANKTGLSFVLNDHGHALIYKPSWGGVEQTDGAPIYHVVDRIFPDVA